MSDRTRNSEPAGVGLGKEGIGSILRQAQSMPNTWRNLILVQSDATNARDIIGDFLGGLAGHLRLPSASALVRGGAFEQREHGQECRTSTWTGASVFSRALIR